jgi:LysR family transcriptional regulator, hydrogen peroxide-inducible genes activator
MPALPSVRQLRYFVSLAEHLHFRKAAEAIYVTQPTLSAGIKELESTLGLALFERDKTKVRLTGAGDAVLARARSLVAQAQDLVEVAHGLAEPLATPFRLGAIPTVAPFLLPTLLPVLRTRFPKLELYLREDLSARLIEALAVGELDAVMIALPYPTDQLIVREILRDEFWFVGPEGEPVSDDERIPIDRIPVDRLLLLEEGHCLRDHAIQACGRDVRTRRALDATSVFTLLQMVESGMGVTLLPEIAVKAGILKNSKLIARPIGGAKPPVRTIALATRESMARRRDFDLLADTIIERLRDGQPPRPNSPAAMKKAAK